MATPQDAEVSKILILHWQWIRTRGNQTLRTLENPPLIDSFFHRYPAWWTNILLWKDPPFLMGKSTISMAIFNCYVSSPEGKHHLYVDVPWIVHWHVWVPEDNSQESMLPEQSCAAGHIPLSTSDIPKIHPLTPDKKTHQFNIPHSELGQFTIHSPSFRHPTGRYWKQLETTKQSLTGPPSSVKAAVFR